MDALSAIKLGSCGPRKHVQMNLVIPDYVHYAGRLTKLSRDYLHKGKDLYTGILFIPDFFLSCPHKFLGSAQPCPYHCPGISDKNPDWTIGIYAKFEAYSLTAWEFQNIEVKFLPRRRLGSPRLAEQYVLRANALWPQSEHQHGVLGSESYSPSYLAGTSELRMVAP